MPGTRGRSADLTSAMIRAGTCHCWESTSHCWRYADEHGPDSRATGSVSFYVDFDTLERTPKLSAHWFRAAARQNAVV